MIEIHLHGQKPIRVKSLQSAASVMQAAIEAECRRTICERKVRYGHHATAVKAVEAMQAKGREGLSAYECGFCDGWHIGHER